MARQENARGPVRSTGRFRFPILWAQQDLNLRLPPCERLEGVWIHWEICLSSTT